MLSSLYVDALLLRESMRIHAGAGTQLDGRADMLIAFRIKTHFATRSEGVLAVAKILNYNRDRVVVEGARTL